MTAAGVTVAMLSVVYGSHVRERVESGSPTLNSDSVLPGLEASNQQIPESDFYRGLVLLLRRNFVEPITDERKLAVGAVKGMVDSLHDPRSTYMDSNEFRAFNDATAGKYEGIGVDLSFEMGVGKGHTGANQASDMDPSDMAALTIPRLTVVAVTPGGPAEQAGIKPGDWVETVEDHWVLNPAPVGAYRKAIQMASPDHLKGLTPEETHKRQQAARTMAAQLKAKLDTMIMPLRAKDMLTIGSTGSLKIVWHRGDNLRTTQVTKHPSQVPIVENDGSVITLRFADGAAQKLKQAVTGKQEITLDLRDNSNGDYDVMTQCLAELAPSGNYGVIHAPKSNKNHAFTVANGNPKPPKMVLLVDRTTRGAANIFANALASKKLAKLAGTPSRDLSVIEVVNLPDGSGYTLATGEYSAKSVPAPKRVAMRSKRSTTSTFARERDGSIVAMRKTKGGNA